MNTGADPVYGGKGGENGFYEVLGKTHSDDPDEKQGWCCKNRFFVCLDEGNFLFKRVMPRMYTLIASIGENCTYDQSLPKKIPLVIISLLEGWCSPILKFRLAPDSPIQFTSDTTGYPEGYVGYTTQLIPTDNIGLYGSFYEGLNGKWIERIQNNPAQFAQGLLKLLTLVASIVLLVTAIGIYPWVATATTIYLTVCGLEALGRLLLPLVHQVKEALLNSDAPGIGVVA